MLMQWWVIQKLSLVNLTILLMFLLSLAAVWSPVFLDLSVRIVLSSMGMEHSMEGWFMDF